MDDIHPFTNSFPTSPAFDAFHNSASCTKDSALLMVVAIQLYNPSLMYLRMGEWMDECLGEWMDAFLVNGWMNFWVKGG